MWLVARRDDAGIEDLGHVRLVPLRRVVTITAGGVATIARIVDVSRSGVAVTATRHISVDDEVLIKSTPTVAVRVFPGVFAARFVEALPPTFDTTTFLTRREETPMLPRFARILVVDDSAVTRKAVRAMLEQIGLVNIDEASDGAEALGKIAMRRYALVASDWFMEPTPGIELLMKLRRTERGRRLPFIMMTAQNRRCFMEVARDAAATHFLAKPFAAQTLAAKIESICSIGDDQYAEASNAS